MVEGSQKQPDDRRIDTAQGRLRAGFAPDLFPERQCSDDKQERRHEHGDEAQSGNAPAADHGTEVSRKGEQRAGHGLRGTVAREELIVRNSTDRYHFRLQQRQHDVAAAERTLEEQHIFPEVRKAGGPNEKLVEVLLVQHQRGREITDYLYRLGSLGQLGNQSEPLANALASMARMYQAHSAWEDTVIFPAWKKTQSKARLDELAEKFEEIEHQQFGKDGFDDAVQRIARIEQSLGLADLGTYTADHPPAL